MSVLPVKTVLLLPEIKYRSLFLFMIYLTTLSVAQTALALDRDMIRE